MTWDLTVALPQNEELYVTDPRALHHIVVKDQYAYEPSVAFMVSGNSFTVLVQL